MGGGGEVPLEPLGAVWGGERRTTSHGRGRDGVTRAGGGRPKAGDGRGGGGAVSRAASVRTASESGIPPHAKERCRLPRQPEAAATRLMCRVTGGMRHGPLRDAGRRRRGEGRDGSRPADKGDAPRPDRPVAGCLRIGRHISVSGAALIGKRNGRE